MIRIATIQDLDQIMGIVQDTIAIMNLEGNTQWDRMYPAREDFQQDIKDNSLYVYLWEDEVAAMICVNSVEPAEYSEIQWRQESDALVIHRMAVSPIYRQKGIARELMNFADQLAKEQHKPYLKTDTYSLNPNMNYLFASHGYVKIGEMNFKGRPFKFYVYDRIIE